MVNPPNSGGISITQHMEEQKSTNISVKPKKTLNTRGLDIIIMGSISLIFFLCPLFFTGFVAQGLGFEKLALFYFFVLLGIVAWVTKGAITGELNLKRTPFDLPIVISLIVFSVSTILSVNNRDSLIGSYGNSTKGLLAIITFVLFYYLVVNNINTTKIKTVFFSFVSSISLIAIYSLLQLKEVYLIPIKYTHNSSFNPIGSLSGLSMFLVMSLPLLVIGASQTKKIFPSLNKALLMVLKIFLIISTITTLMVLFLLKGFVSWPIAVAGMVIVLMFFLAKIIKITNNNLLIPLAVFLVLIIFLVLGNFDFAGMNLPKEVSLSRGASWEIAKKSLRENPIFGSGPATFYYAFSKFKNPNFNLTPLWNVRFDSAYGAFFELLATTGIFGAISVVVLALIALSVSFLTLIRNINKEDNSVMLGLFSSLIMALLFVLFFPYSNSLVLCVVLICVFSASAALTMYGEKFRELKLSFRASPKYALALASIFLCVSAGVVILFTMGLKMYLADSMAQKSLQAATLNEKIAKLNQAISLAPYQDNYYLNLSSHYMALANQAALKGQDQNDIVNSLRLAIDNGRKSVELGENKAANHESLALIYENASFYTRGALEWSEQLYNTLAQLDPSSPKPALRIALINMARANAEKDSDEKKYYIEEAIKNYDIAISKKENLASAYYGKAIASEKLNKIDDAIDQLKKARLVASDNIDYTFELGRLYFNRGISQFDLKQNATRQITENELSGSTSTQQNISVQTQDVDGKTQRNNDLNEAERLFVTILLSNPNHANARYSLAILYQRIGELDKAKIMVTALLDIIKDAKTKEAVMQQFADLL